MAPWANRIDGAGFWANAKKYEFDMTLGNIRKDRQGLPIHGLLSNQAPWQGGIGSGNQNTICRNDSKR